MAEKLKDERDQEIAVLEEQMRISEGALQTTPHLH
jgi:hypothetical protein